MRLNWVGVSALIPIFMSLYFYLAPQFLLPPLLAQVPSNSKSELEQLLQEGIELYENREFETALKYFKKALILYKDTNNESVKALIINIIGKTYSNLGDYSQALQYFNQSLTIRRNLNNYLAQGITLNDIGSAYVSLAQYSKALQYFDKALIIQKQISDSLGEGQTLNYIGTVYSYLGKYSESLKYFEQALVIRRQLHDYTGESTTLNNIGTVYDSLSQYTQALQYYQQALAILEKADNKRDKATILNSIGAAYEGLSQYNKALNYYEQALAIHKQVSDSKGEAVTLSNIGGIYQHWGKSTQAFQYYEQSLAIHKQISDHRGEGTTLSNVGSIYKNMSKYVEALSYYKQALAIHKQTSNSQGEATTLKEIASVYWHLSRYADALSNDEQALAIYKQIGNRTGEGATLSNIASVYYDLGEYYQAINYYEQALAIQREVGNRLGEATIINNIGGVYQNIGQQSQALKYLEQALVIRKQVGDYSGEGQTLSNIGLIYTNIGQHLQALEYLEQSLIIRKQVNDSVGEATTLNNIGLTYKDLNNIDQALKNYDQALVIAKQVGNRALEGNILHNTGVALLKNDNLVKSETNLLAAIDIWESLPSRLSDNNKVSFLETKTKTYQFLQKVLILQNKIIPALEISERGRAKAFSELLKTRLSLQVENESAISYLKIPQIQQIAQAHNTTLIEYSINYGSNKESNLYIWVIQPNGKVEFRQVDLKSLLNDNSLQAVVDNARESIIKNDNIALSSRGVTPDLIIKKGDRIRFKDEPSDWEAWVVLEVNTQTGTLKVRRPSQPPESKDEEGLISEVAQIIDTNTTSSNAKLASLQKLRQLLIDPITDLLPSDPNARVIFIPQGELFSVPFPALQDANGKYLIEKHTILTAPSIQVLQLTREQRQRLSGNAKDVLVVGNPIMPKVALKIGEPAQQLRSLPEAEQEAKAIALLFNTQAKIGKDATKTAILPLLPKAKIIHFATHGLLDDRRGLGSAIALAPDPPSPLTKEGQQESSGLLTAEEILDFKEKLNAELVVLSACDTGQGRITGDGVIGLSRSLIAAGVPSVIVTLWSIPDAPTAPLMTEFYRQWQQNPDKAQALRQAMLTTMKTHPNPRDWAAFTLIGEAQ